MKIIMVTAYFPPRPSAGGNRLASFARGLRKQGIDVTVFAPRFDDDQLADVDLDLAEITYWIPSKSVNRGGFLRRFVDETFICWSLMARARKEQYDACLVTTPFISLPILAGIIVRPSRLIIDIRDLTWIYSFSKNPILIIAQKFIEIIMSFSLRRAALITTSTESELYYIKESRLNLNSVLLSNGIEEAFIGTMEILESTPLPRGSVVTYAGTVGRAQGVSILADAAGRLPNVTFQIAGHGDELPEIEEAVHQGALTNIELLGWLPRSETCTLYNLSDALFCRLRPGFASAVPSKVYEYAAVGRPIIYMGNGQDAAWRKLSEFDGTYLVKDDDIDGLVATIQTALAAPRPDVAYNRSILRNRYTREVQSRDMALIIKNFKL